MLLWVSQRLWLITTYVERAREERFQYPNCNSVWLMTISRLAELLRSLAVGMGKPASCQMSACWHAAQHFPPAIGFLRHHTSGPRTEPLLQGCGRGGCSAGQCAVNVAALHPAGGQHRPGHQHIHPHLSEHHCAHGYSLLHCAGTILFHHPGTSLCPAVAPVSCSVVAESTLACL